MHTFHIPVMGTGFTIDTPVKVAPYGISSVVSIVDDQLIEKMRDHYSRLFGFSYEPITEKSPDHRAKRITSYLDRLHEIVQLKFREVIDNSEALNEKATNYLQMLPESSYIRGKYEHLKKTGNLNKSFTEWLSKHLSPGSIDVNIMTKVDKENYSNGETLPVQFNDAHAALRGFANSKLNASVVFSAGMNPRLFSYITNFNDFFPDKNGNLQKKITLKVSDYRSALVQGKMLAKKGLWVSEFRIESGLNCGGHAFATEGHLLGPVLESFRQGKNELQQSLYKIYRETLTPKGYELPDDPFPVKLSVQGGVGNADEHQFLLDHYKFDSVGWGSPFLLVPEAVNIDDYSLKLLKKAGEKDLYLSNVSPLGIPFNNLKNNTTEQDKEEKLRKGRPGSSCPKKFLSFNKEFTDKPICTASREYQHKKLQELESLDLSSEDYEQKKQKITEKSCICNGLGNTALLVNGLDTRKEGTSTSICPGPNMAYFDKTVSLQEMIDHIYGRKNIISRIDRPNMFIKELNEYVKWFKNLTESTPETEPVKHQKRLNTIRNNLQESINYYKNLQTSSGESYFTQDDFQVIQKYEHEISEALNSSIPEFH